MKHVLLIGDGMADLPLDPLDGKTALEAARTPAMDALCAMGRVGSVKTVPDGFPVGSDTAILSIFGCDPASCYAGRAPLEAAGMGLTVEPGETALRANLISVEGDDFLTGAIVSHAGDGIETRDAQSMLGDLIADPGFAALMKRARMRLGLGEAFRNIALFSGLDAPRLQTTPPHDILSLPLRPYLPKGEDSLIGIMRASYDFLARHPMNAERLAKGLAPANCLWFWGEGRASALPGFAERFGTGGAVISAVPLVRGIARLCGLEAPEIPGANGGLDTDYDAKVRAAMTALGRHDFAAIHYEAPDECSHAGDLEGKLLGIERFDARIVAPVAAELTAMGGPWRVLILPDHPTPLSLRTHHGQCVPYILAGSGIAPSGIPRMTEPLAMSLPPVDPGIRLIGELMR